MEDFKEHLQAAIDAIPSIDGKTEDQKLQVKGDLMRMFYIFTGERPRV